MKVFCAILIISCVFTSGTLGGGPSCGNFNDLARQLSSYLQNEYINTILEYSTDSPNLQIAQMVGMTNALLTFQTLSAQDRSTLTAIKNGGEDGARCVFNFLESSI